MLLCMVFPYPDVQRADGAADVDGRAFFALKAVNTVGDEAQAATGHSTIRQKTLFLGLAFKGIPIHVSLLDRW